MTTPALVTVAIAVLLLAHVPPVVGLSCVVDNLHIAVGPSIETIGFASTVTIGLGLDAQFVVLLVNIKVEVPAVKPVTKPPFVTDATAGFVLVHVPPVLGDRVVVLPIHTLAALVIIASGQNIRGVGSLLLVGSPS